MWEWGSYVAERATAGTLVGGQDVETQPTILDPEVWAGEVDGAEDSDRGAAAPNPEFDLVG